jgi:hypothetical protein
VIVVENAWNAEESTTITTTTITMGRRKEKKPLTSDFWLPFFHLRPLNPLNLSLCR